MAKYTTTATAKGGRNGKVKTNDAVLDLKVSVPKVFGGEEDGHTNPEQLLACGWAACFDNAILMTAKAQKAEVDSQTSVEITLGPLSGGGVGLSAVIKAEIGGVEEDVAQRILASAHRVCPFSKATKGNIEVDVQLIN